MSAAKLRLRLISDWPRRMSDPTLDAIFLVQKPKVEVRIRLEIGPPCKFMKTCAFDNLKGRSKQENLLIMNLPEAHYGMKQCRDKNFLFCYERLDLTN
jgi:hypothetical protein